MNISSFSSSSSSSSSSTSLNQENSLDLDPALFNRNLLNGLPLQGLYLNRFCAHFLECITRVSQQALFELSASLPKEVVVPALFLMKINNPSCDLKKMLNHNTTFPPEVNKIISDVHQLFQKIMNPNSSFAQKYALLLEDKLDFYMTPSLQWEHETGALSLAHVMRYLFIPRNSSLGYLLTSAPDGLSHFFFDPDENIMDERYCLEDLVSLNPNSSSRDCIQVVRANILKLNQNTSSPPPSFYIAAALQWCFVREQPFYLKDFEGIPLSPIQQKLIELALAAWPSRNKSLLESVIYQLIQEGADESNLLFPWLFYLTKIAKLNPLSYDDSPGNPLTSLFGLTAFDTLSQRSDLYFDVDVELRKIYEGIRIIEPEKWGILKTPFVILNWFKLHQPKKQFRKLSELKLICLILLSKQADISDGNRNVEQEIKRSNWSSLFIRKLYGLKEQTRMKISKQLKEQLGGNCLVIPQAFKFAQDYSQLFTENKFNEAEKLVYDTMNTQDQHQQYLKVWISYLISHGRISLVDGTTSFEKDRVFSKVMQDIKTFFQEKAYLMHPNLALTEDDKLKFQENYFYFSSFISSLKENSTALNHSLQAKDTLARAFVTLEMNLLLFSRSSFQKNPMYKEKLLKKDAKFNDYIRSYFPIFDEIITNNSPNLLIHQCVQNAIQYPETNAETVQLIRQLFNIGVSPFCINFANQTPMEIFADILEKNPQTPYEAWQNTLSCLLEAMRSFEMQYNEPKSPKKVSSPREKPRKKAKQSQQSPPNAPLVQPYVQPQVPPLPSNISPHNGQPVNMISPLHFQSLNTHALPGQNFFTPSYDEYPPLPPSQSNISPYYGPQTSFAANSFSPHLPPWHTFPPPNLHLGSCPKEKRYRPSSRAQSSSSNSEENSEENGQKTIITLPPETLTRLSKIPKKSTSSNKKARTSSNPPKDVSDD